MPYWTPEEEKALVSMAGEGRTVDEICERFHRSPEAIKLKLRRLGAVIPQSQKEVDTTRNIIEPKTFYMSRKFWATSRSEAP